MKNGNNYKQNIYKKYLRIKRKFLEAMIQEKNKIIF